MLKQKLPGEKIKEELLNHMNIIRDFKTVVIKVSTRKAR
jgi:hypothetical protein